MASLGKELSRYLNAEKRQLIRIVENLWDKYAILERSSGIVAGEDFGEPRRSFKRSGVRAMSPTDWTTGRLGSVTSLIKDGTHGTHEDVAEGVPLLSAKDVRDGVLKIPDDCRRISESDYKVIHKNYSIQDQDILVTIVGTIGRCYRVTGSEPLFTIQRSVAVLRPDAIDSNYLFHFCRSESFQRQLRDVTNASAQGGVYLGALANCKIDYPCEELEQSKIAEILSTVDRVIEQTEALIEKQQRIKTGLMQDLLTRGIDKKGNLRSEDTHKFKDLPWGEFRWSG